MAYNSLINSTKTGECSICNDGKIQDVVKHGKVLLCVRHNKERLTKKSAAKQKEKLAVRSLNTYQKEEGLLPKGTAELQRWFEERRKEMTGVCKHCNGKTEKYTDKFRCSIAHILPKAYFRSIATHPKNFIELCFYGKSCHTNLDQHIIDITELNCFDEVINKFIEMYPDIAQDERRRIPAILLEYVKSNN